jgi:hypothetical protein
MGEGQPFGITAQGQEERREQRHAIRVPVVLRRGKDQVMLQTEDVSFRGLFVRTDAPLPVRQLVKLEMPLPPDQQRVVLHGMVSRAVRPGPRTRVPGMGIQLMALDGDLKKAWERFVLAVQGGTLDAVWLEGTPDLVRRRFVRYQAELCLVVDHLRDLGTLVTTNVSLGGMFIATELDLGRHFPMGQRVHVRVVHPRTRAMFPLDCVVRRHVADTTARGVGVEFLVDEAQRNRFRDFMREEVPELGGEETSARGASAPSRRDTSSPARA